MSNRVLPFGSKPELGDKERACHCRTNVHACCFSGVRFKTQRSETKTEGRAVVSRSMGSDNQVEVLCTVCCLLTNKLLQRHQAIRDTGCDTGKSKPEAPEAHTRAICKPVLKYERAEGYNCWDLLVFLCICTLVC